MRRMPGKTQEQSQDNVTTLRWCESPSSAQVASGVVIGEHWNGLTSDVSEIMASFWNVGRHRSA